MSVSQFLHKLQVFARELGDRRHVGAAVAPVQVERTAHHRLDVGGEGAEVRGRGRGRGRAVVADGRRVAVEDGRGGEVDDESAAELVDGVGGRRAAVCSTARYRSRKRNATRRLLPKGVY